MRNLTEQQLKAQKTTGKSQEKSAGFHKRTERESKNNRLSLKG